MLRYNRIVSRKKKLSVKVIDSKADRMAAALRVNLRKRKNQARARQNVEEYGEKSTDQSVDPNTQKD